MSVPANTILDKKVNASYAKVFRSEISPLAGSSYNFGDRTQFSIPTAPNDWLNCQNSGVRFQVVTTATANDARFRLDQSGAHNFISRLTVKHGSNQWEYIDPYQIVAKEYSSFYTPMSVNLNKNNMLQGTRGDYILDASGNSTMLSPSVRKINTGDIILNNVASTTTSTRTFFIPLMSILGLMNQNAYLPLCYLTASPILVEIVWADTIYRLGNSSGAHTISISNCAFVSELIRCNDEAMSMIVSQQQARTGGVIEMPFVGIDLYSFTTGTLSNNSRVSVNIPAKFSSLKSLVATHRQTTRIATTGYYPFSSVVNGLASYQWRVGSELIPNSGPVSNLTDMYGEVCKCFGSLNDVYFPTNTDKISYEINDNAVALNSDTGLWQPISGSFMIGLDCESWPSQDKSKLWAGMDTRNSDIFLNLTYGTIAQNQMTIDCVAYSDKKLVIQNGVGYIEF